MAIEKDEYGNLTITGSHINLYRILTLKSGLKLEIAGMKLSRGRSCFSIVKEEFGLKGNKQSVLDQFSKMIDKWKEEGAFG